MEIVWFILIIVIIYAIAQVFQYMNDTKSMSASNSEELNKTMTILDKKIELSEQRKADIITLKNQLSDGFPLLADAYSEYLALFDGQYAEYLNNKIRPAPSSAELVKQFSKQKREAIRELRITQKLMQLYENLAPFLMDARKEFYDEIEARELLQDYTEEEKEDPVINYLSKDEYRKLPTVERNQRALNRYWERWKTKQAIGFLYERYIGYLYEEKGYEVKYQGIERQLGDLGRDLIAIKGKETLIIQCKNWSQFSTIHEKHVFQLFGTVYRYKFDHKDHNVKAVFHTSTSLSDIARQFGKDLGIEIIENFPLKRYPCIKCNINKRTKEKIYHLPMDQQYDKVVIERNYGEKYLMTVKEAEDLGFRRAFRWKGNKQNFST